MWAVPTVASKDMNLAVATDETLVAVMAVSWDNSKVVVMAEN